MQTECLSEELSFQDLSKRKVVAKFNGRSISTESGALLLREVENGIGILKLFSECFIDYRNANKIEHKLEELISQRIYGIALGYEDLNDHDSLMTDTLLSVLCNKADPTGQNRRRDEDKGKALAGKSTH